MRMATYSASVFLFVFLVAFNLNAQDAAPASKSRVEIRNMPVRLLASEADFAKTVSAIEIGGFIKSGGKVVREHAQKATTNFDLRIIYTVPTDGKLAVKILRRGTVDKDWLSKLGKQLGALDFPGNGSRELKFEVGYRIIADQEQFDRELAKRQKQNDASLADAVRDEMARDTDQRAAIQESDGDPAEILQEAKEFPWLIVKAFIEKLEKSDPKAFPGIHDWLRDFHEATGNQIPAAKPIDVEALVTNNPNYWRAHFEVSPGDPGWAFIHVGLLQSCGEMKRAHARLQIARLSFDDQVIFRTADAMNYQLMRVFSAFSPRTNEGIKLHDAKEFEAAIAHYQSILDIWPQYAWCLYELSLSQHSANTVAAGNELLSDDTVLTDPAAVAEDQRKNPLTDEVKKWRIMSRRHDPLFWQNLSGMPEGKQKIAAIVRGALPILKEMSSGNEITNQKISALASILQFIEAHDLAIPAACIVVRRQNELVDADHKFVTKSLKALVPGPEMDATLARLGSGKDQAFLSLFGN